MPEGRAAPWRAGASVSGRGTPDSPCLAVSRPVRLRWELRGETPDDEVPIAPMLSFFHGDRWVATEVFTQSEFESGIWQAALAEPVMLALEGWARPTGAVVGMFLAFTFLELEPRWLRLGLDFRSAEDRRFRGDTCAEIRDILLYRLFGRANEQVEKLLSGISGPDGEPNDEGRPS